MKWEGHKRECGVSKEGEEAGLDHGKCCKPKPSWKMQIYGRILNQERERVLQFRKVTLVATWRMDSSW